ncbi:MAG TPA: hypothetical protein PKO41_07350 [Dokdonella sp.]|uniref:hypothetical protein n=1 Tax=Dokdonella sp. TaxID=2291710 RepID=UPI0025C46E41|nr:hypothetical protein [Dokdonella sp.]MBX3693369.1 hypothetical protein [Dokdonella sp.]MCW5567197.1 hypothetical protein [Dokdonella sp.]HNR92223.1 hypothetical protein [Dokdonella sp.]
MNAPTNELLLALRAPTSGWLAAVICALDEALLDHDFSPAHRELLRNLLDAGEVPTVVANAAQDRLQRFEEAVQTLHEALIGSPEPVAESAPARRHLTLCA